METYDAVVIGAGPAAIGAITYLKRADVHYLWLEKGAPGGKLLNIHEIANCPGFMATDGFSLAQKLLAPLEENPTYGEVTSIKQTDNGFLLSYNGDNEVSSKTVLLATGLSNTPKIPGEKKYLGHGVSYCATCDGPLFKGKRALIEGDGEKAFEEALYLSSLVKELHLLFPGESFSNDDMALKKQGNVIFHPHARLSKILGENDSNHVSMAEFTEGKSVKSLPIDVIFPLLHEETDTFFLRHFSLKMNKGFIVTDEAMQTSVPGLFAAGDIVDKKLRQVVTALADGAIASSGIVSFIRKRKD